MRIPKQMAEDLILFGMINDFLRINSAKNRGEAEEFLLEFKKTLASSYKKLAMDNHPDRGGDEEKMKEISAAMNRLKKLRIREPQRQMRVFIQTVPFGGFNSSGSTTYTSTGTGSTTFTFHRF
jgi:hypothetical protein